MTQKSLYTSMLVGPLAMLTLPPGICAAQTGADAGRSFYDQKVVEGGGDGISLARWIGGWCTWTNPSNWFPPAVPDNDPVQGPWGTTFHVVIDRDGATDSVVELDAEVTIARLWINPGDTLVLGPGGGLALANSLGPATVTNSGHVALAGGIMPASLHLAQTTELHGGGVLSLQNALTAIVRATEAGVSADLGRPALINADNHIRGTGRIGLGEIALVNHALIDADVHFAAITIHPNEYGCTNRGLMRASGGGWLRLIDGYYDNEDGVIAALPGSFVEIEGATIDGGVLNTIGNGVIRTMETPAAWRSITNEGGYMLGPTSLHWTGHITNSGLIQIVGDLTVSPGQPASEVVLDLDGLQNIVTLAGDGVLTMLSTVIHAPAGSPDVHLVHEASHTLRGEGRIGSGRTSFFNHGTVVADQNLMLLLNPGSGRIVENHGHLLATGLGGMGVLSGTFENIGTVEVRDGSRFITIPGTTVVNAGGGALVGGTWRVMAEQLPTLLNLTCGNILTNAADVTLSGPGALFPRFDAVSFNAGTIRLYNGRTFTTNASFSNYGELEIGVGSTMTVNGPYTQGSMAVLRLEVDGASADFGQLMTSGSVSLSGAIEIALLEGAELGAGDVLPIITASAVNGSFSNVSLPPGVKLSYTPTAVLLSATE